MSAPEPRVSRLRHQGWLSLCGGTSDGLENQGISATCTIKVAVAGDSAAK